MKDTAVCTIYLIVFDLWASPSGSGNLTGSENKESKREKTVPRRNVGFADVDERLSSGKLGKMLNARIKKKRKIDPSFGYCRQLQGCCRENT